MTNVEKSADLGNLVEQTHVFRFPKIGLAPVIIIHHPLLDGMFPNKNHPADVGYLHFGKPIQ